MPIKNGKITIITCIFSLMVFIFIYNGMHTFLFGTCLLHFYLIYLMQRKSYKFGSFASRVKLLLNISFILILIVVIRLFKIQVLDHNKYEARVKNQVESTYSIVGDRGKIMDYTGKSLAYNSNIYTVAIDPVRVYKNKPAMEFIEEISKRYVNIDYDYLKNNIEKLSNNKRRYKVIAQDLEEGRKKEIEKLMKEKYNLRHNELFFQKNSSRQYYRSDVFANLAGLTGYTSSSEASKVGIFGIEKQYEKYLRGREREKKDIFTRSRFMKLPTAQDESEISVNGKNVYLTVDYFLQYILNDEIKKQFIDTKSEMALGLIMDPNTGKILAMTSMNKTKQKNLKNQVIQNQYEPGSTFKPIVVASAMEEGVLSPDDTFDVGDGKLLRHRHTIRESSRKTKGVLTTEEILKKSSNVGMVLISDRLKEKTFEEYLRGFGFGAKTDIDFPGELKPYLQPSNKWNGLTKTTMAFGQGIAVTPIQLATAFSAVVNGGIMYKPYLVDKIAGEDGIVLKRNTPHPVRQVISPKVSREVRTMLEHVVADGTGKNARVEGYRIGGKTGTAQISSQGRYLRGEYLSSFLGFFPANNPQYVMLFMFLKPQADIYYEKYGGFVAAPVFGNVAKRIIKHKNMLPGDIEYLRAEKLNVPKILSSEALTEMPDLSGKSARETLRILGKLGLEIEMSGTGLVNTQWPEKGTSLEKISKIKVYLK